jgi:hypothetical protein
MSFDLPVEKPSSSGKGKSLNFQVSSTTTVDEIKNKIHNACT